MTISASISRRSLLQAGAGAAIPLFAGCVSLPGAQPLPIDPAMQADWLWHRQLWMNNLGPRLTGNPAHLAFVDFIAAELAAMGLVVQEDVQHFPRWEAGRSAIAVRENGLEADAIAVASDYPYSASTGPDGITGPLVFGGSVGAERSGVDLKDAILYLDAPVAPLEFGRLYDDVRRYGTLQDFPAAVAQASGQIVSAPGLESYSERGAKAVILGWTNISEEQAQGQYIPFNRPPQAIPGLWVGPGAATRLKSLAPSSPEINLTLDAKVIPDAASRTVYAVVPGASDDLIIVTTHSDGPNATEENGPLAMLAMARNLMQADPASRSCSVLFVFASGPFVGPAAGSTDRFLELHPEYRARRRRAGGRAFGLHGMAGRCERPLCPHGRSRNEPDLHSWRRNGGHRHRCGAIQCRPAWCGGSCQGSDLLFRRRAPARASRYSYDRILASPILPARDGAGRPYREA